MGSGNGDGVFGWPRRGLDEAGYNYYPIFYCFDTVDAARQWEIVVTKAIEKWQLALYPYSGLRIQLHPYCRGNSYVTCNQIRSPTDWFKIEDGGGEGSSSSSTGYDYYERNPYEKLTLRGYDARTHDMLVVDCAHELGHTMGLGHEHQRPDRDEWLEFHCNNLAGASAAHDDIDENGDSDIDFIGLNHDQRFDMACTTRDKAERYFPEALSYIKYEYLGYPWTNFEKDAGALDVDSIMIYSTWQAIDEEPDEENDFDYAELFYYDEHANLAAIYQGGNLRPLLAGPTRRNVMRVIYLYPKWDGQAD
ncbi:hypothetical protein M409DRAFT_17822 [Zasmidium cellare ATCC 36951]|uniref:Peptidase metallopeptidase domain-containing protein n=1 Tax=Zasmidium cellare ATCC 36951 TaxID=1080233 RepID=A0A6A6D094_ZASCE|nr:uncharacterized protein M409DRAFT_17822 [Zasmidium cellare ATCC 36951]KAF2171582.1 hypothetical protein M409DRAFT_17822 [Zasmidium cellare ATCC 36951]